MEELLTKATSTLWAYQTSVSLNSSVAPGNGSGGLA